MAHLTKREKEILGYLKKDPMISQDELAARMHISRSAAAVHISNLMRKGYIIGRGYILDERSRILVVGKTWLEIVAQVEVSRISISCGGLGYTMAAELSRHQVTPTLVTMLGQDEIGDQLYQYLLRNGINVQHIIRTRSYPTPKRLIVRQDDTTLYEVMDEKIEHNLIKRAMKTRDELLKTVKVLVLDGTLGKPAIEGIYAHIKEFNVQTAIVGCSFDWYKQQGFFGCPQFFLVCQDSDLESFSGEILGGIPENSFPICSEIASQGLAALIVIFGQQGLVLATKKEVIFLPASPLKGTGTLLSITAGIAGGLAAGYGFRMAARRAMGKTELS